MSFSRWKKEAQWHIVFAPFENTPILSTNCYSHIRIDKHFTHRRFKYSQGECYRKFGCFWKETKIICMSVYCYASRNTISHNNLQSIFWNRRCICGFLSIWYRWNVRQNHACRVARLRMTVWRTWFFIPSAASIHLRNPLGNANAPSHFCVVDLLWRTAWWRIMPEEVWKEVEESKARHGTELHHVEFSIPDKQKNFLIFYAILTHSLLT